MGLRLVNEKFPTGIGYHKLYIRIQASQVEALTGCKASLVPSTFLLLIHNKFSPGFRATGATVELTRTVAHTHLILSENAEFVFHSSVHCDVNMASLKFSHLNFRPLVRPFASSNPQSCN